jgi:hypothetical protein
MLVSFFVAMLLAFFNIEPKKLLKNLSGIMQGIFEIVAQLVEWVVKHTLQGGCCFGSDLADFILIGNARSK